jgi:sugar lactone lactonase YvrE
VFARDLGAPDDLLVLPDGTMWVSDPAHGTLRHLSAEGRPLETIADPEEPEGIAQLPDGRFAVAEQRLNRVVTVRPPSIVRTPLFELPPAGTALGVDGIAFDGARDRLLVPDSPHGTLVVWPYPTGPARVIARGLGRGVGVVAASNGDVYVTAEAASGLLRIVAGGGAPVGGIVQADDIVAADGWLYVTLIDSGQVVAVDASTGAHHVLVTGVGAAQGLALMRDGRLAIADSDRGVIAIARACS